MSGFRRNNKRLIEKWLSSRKLHRRSEENT
jgi:hypothetical protein